MHAVQTKPEGLRQEIKGRFCTDFWIFVMFPPR